MKATLLALGGAGLVLLIGLAVLAILRRRSQAQRPPLRPVEPEFLPEGEPRPTLDFRVTERVGVGVINPRGVTRLALSTEERPPLARTRAGKKSAAKKTTKKKPESQKQPQRAKRGRRTRFDRLDDD